eukprot:6179669-Pleurochrysis_carterae.AAC.3
MKASREPGRLEGWPGQPEVGGQGESSVEAVRDGVQLEMTAGEAAAESGQWLRRGLYTVLWPLGCAYERGLGLVHIVCHRLSPA